MLLGLHLKLRSLCNSLG